MCQVLWHEKTALSDGLFMNPISISRILFPALFERGGSNLSGPGITVGIERHPATAKQWPRNDTERTQKVAERNAFAFFCVNLRLVCEFLRSMLRIDSTALHSGKDFAVSLPHFGGHAPHMQCM